MGEVSGGRALYSADCGHLLPSPVSPEVAPNQCGGSTRTSGRRVQHPICWACRAPGHQPEALRLPQRLGPAAARCHSGSRGNPAHRAGDTCPLVPCAFTSHTGPEPGSAPGLPGGCSPPARGQLGLPPPAPRPGHPGPHRSTGEAWAPEAAGAWPGAAGKRKVHRSPTGDRAGGSSGPHPRQRPWEAQHGLEGAPEAPADCSPGRRTEVPRGLPRVSSTARQRPDATDGAGAQLA